MLFLAAAVSCLCGVLYILFGRAEPLDWVVSDRFRYVDQPDVLYAPVFQQNDLSETWNSGSVEEDEIQTRINAF